MQIFKRNADNIEVNLIGVLQLLWKKFWLILLCGILFAVAGYMGAMTLLAPKYTASITLYVNNSASADSSTSITSGDLSASAMLVDTYAAIISSNTVLEDVIDQAGVPMTASQLREMVSAISVNNTEVFQVLVEDTDPQRAALLANTLAEIFPTHIADIVEGSSVKIVDYAVVPTEQSSPNCERYAQIGMALGLVVSVVAILVRTLTDTRIKNESDLSAWNYPVLGVIPEYRLAMKMKQYGYSQSYKGVKK